MRINFFKKSFIIVFFYLILAETYSYELQKDVFLKTSFFVLQRDSLDKEFLEIKNFLKKEDYIKSLEKSFIYLNSLKKDDYIKKYQIQNLIAEVYDRTLNTSKSLVFYKKALASLNYGNSIDKKENFKSNSKEYAETFHNIGGLFQKIGKIDSAKYFYNKVIKLPEIDNSILDYKASTYSNLSGIYEVDSLYDKAEIFARKAIKIHKLRNNKINQAFSLNNLGNIYLSKGDFNKSKDIYFNAIELIKNHTSTKAINLKADLYYNLAWAMRNLEEIEAYDNLETSYDFTDQLRKKEYQRMLEQITAEYNIETFKKEAKDKRLIQQQKFWILAAISFIIIISLIFYLIFYQQRKKTLALKLANMNHIQKQKIDAVKSESQTRVLNATIDGKETERKEIAETLHDNVSALLSSANLHLQASRKHFNGNIPIEFFKSEQIINEASEKIRNLSHTLVSSILLKFGLTYAVKDIVEKYTNSDLKITTDIDKLRRYSQSFEIKTFNIIQEFLNNILKHSKATSAFVVLKENNGSLQIRISDDGIGFDKSKVDEKDGLGINQIDARIKIMKGTFFINTNLGKGTEVKIELPIQEKEGSLSA